MNAIANNGPSYSPAQQVDEDEIDLGDLLGVLIENRWLILGITLVIFALGTTYAFVATPIYKADGLIQVEEKRSGLGNLDISALFEGDTSVNAEIEIFRSRLVLGAVVDNLKLAIKAEPDYFPIFGVAIARRADPKNRKSMADSRHDAGDIRVGHDVRVRCNANLQSRRPDTD